MNDKMNEPQDYGGWWIFELAEPIPVPTKARRTTGHNYKFAARWSQIRRQFAFGSRIDCEWSASRTMPIQSGRPASLL